MCYVCAHCVCVTVVYRRRLMFWSATNGRVYTGSFMNRTKLNNVTHRQVIEGNPWDQLVIGKLSQSMRCGMILPNMDRN